MQTAGLASRRSTPGKPPESKLNGGEGEGLQTRL
jgi:hypothetical protein